MQITPDTNVAALLTEHPELESALADHSPSFAAPRNAVLRNAMAKVTTLGQLAAADGKPVGPFVNAIREAAGVDATASGVFDGAPSWLVPDAVAVRYDARADLAAGMHPAQRVMGEVGSLAPGAVFELVTPFVPGPLLDMARGRGYEAWSRRADDGTVSTYFFNPRA